MRCRYNAVNFLQNSHNGHPIARPWGRAMGCVLWVWSLIYVLLLPSQRRMSYRDELDRIVTAHMYYVLIDDIDMGQISLKGLIMNQSSHQFIYRNMPISHGVLWSLIKVSFAIHSLHIIASLALRQQSKHDGELWVNKQHKSRMNQWCNQKNEANPD